MPSALDPHAAVDHLPRLYGLARSLSGSRHLAEDVTQETYLRVLSRPRRVRGDGEYPYLARTLRNVLNDHWRSEQRRTSHTHALPRLDGDPETAVLAREVYAAVGELPDRLRDVVVAVDVAGLSYAQAAQTLGIPQGTVMSRLHRGRSRVADALGH
jgi:RNA polymerase sigma-70 factor (ECF subfamily)